MKTNVKRVLALLLTLVLSCSILLVPAGAASTQAQDAAAELFRLGLFQGKGVLADGSPNFDLDGAATRAEGTVMLVRLLGGEQEALNTHYSHPFTDAGWAGDYLGYAFQKGIANGIGNNQFGSNNRITAAEFLTMLLRAMGYSQVDWRNPYPTANSVGLAYSGVNDFRRGDMAYICCSALSCPVNGTNQTLRQRLEAQGVITNAAAPAGFTPGPVAPTAASSYRVTSAQEALSAVYNAINARVETITLTGPVSILDACQQAAIQAQELCSETNGYSTMYTYNRTTMTISFTPFYTDAVEIMAYLEGKRSSLSQDNQTTLAKARQIHASLVNPSMSEYDQVKAFHDYLAGSVTYGGTTSRVFTAAGALVDGRAVCDGYSMALDLLCYLSGIDCIRVTGFANSSHAWNKVKVGGSWYNVDVTWDDTDSSYYPTSYDYFLISDAAISRDHTFDSNPYWPAAPANYRG